MALLNVSGLELDVEGNTLSMSGIPMSYTSRKLEEMKDVLLDSSIAEGKGSVEAYFMFRSVIDPSDADLFKERAVRFDITIIPNIVLGMECNKTAGHYHAVAEPGLSFPEVYVVVEGMAMFLLQRRLDDSFYVELVQAKAGDVMLIPPNYGHITVNSGKGRLVLANLVSNAFESDYKGIAEMRGGAVYVLADGTLVINKHYKRFSITRLESPPKVPALAGLDSTNIYKEFVKNPDRFGFLNKPSLL